MTECDCDINQVIARRSLVNSDLLVSIFDWWMTEESAVTGRTSSAKLLGPSCSRRKSLICF